MFSLRTHWRNLWRNRRRTLITIGAVATNTMVLLFLLGYVNGFFVQLTRSASGMTLGEVQVHAPDYLLNRQLHKVIADPQAILDRAREQGIVAAPRVYGFGLLAVREKSNGAMLWGVDPAAERACVELPQQIHKGRYLSDANTKVDGLPEVVLGARLAQTLHAAVGDELLAFVQAADGSGFDTLFRVVGILKVMGESVDRTTAIIHADEFRRIFYPPSASAWYAQPDGQVNGAPAPEPEPDQPEQPPDTGSGFDLFNDYQPGTEAPVAPPIDPANWTPPFLVHEIALSSGGTLPPEQIQALIQPVASSNEVRTWKQLNKAIAAMLEASSASIGLMYFIFFLLAGLSVLNTMLMATFERMREFGVMKAIGTSPWRLVGDVAGEAFVLGVFAAVIGSILGAVLTIILGYVGLDFSGILAEGASFAGMAFDPVQRPLFKFTDVPAPLIGMTIICVLASLYPAWIAARVDPARILHEQ